MNTLRQVTALAIVFFLVGVGFFGVGAVQFLEARAFIRTAQTVAGRVVDLEYRSSSGRRSGGGYVTVFTFSDASGVTHTARTSSAQNPAPYQIGDKVVVLYQPALPEDARIRSFRTLWILPTILGGVGLAFSSIGAFAFVAGRKTYGPAHDAAA